MPPTATKVIYINPEAGADLTCDWCGRTQRVAATTFGTQASMAKIRCQCNHRFTVKIERRRATRVRTHLLGDYVKLMPQPPSGEFSRGKEPRAVEVLTVSGRMLVEDLSFFGLCFRTDIAQPFQRDDLIRLRFVLAEPDESQIYKIDDWSRPRVVKYARIRWMHGRQMGAEFCDPSAYADALDTYLKRHTGLS